MSSHHHHDAALPVAHTRNSVSRRSEPWIIQPHDQDPPHIVTPAQRVIVPIEGFFTFPAGVPLQILALLPQLQSKRYAKQVWFYGIKSIGGNPAVPVPNVNVVYWGWSAETLVNQVQQYAGTFGSLIEPGDGQVVDLQSLWFQGTATDGLLISAL